MNTDLDLLNAEVLDDSILNNTFKYSNAEGEDAEYEDEENTDSEPSDEEGVSEEELPKFRTLVKNKKLEMKAQYGKSRIVTEKKCNKVPYPCPTIKEPLKVCYKDVCVNVPKFQSGWRKKWREFKKAGGLAQLKLQARGLAPIPTQAPTTSPRGLMFRGKLLDAPVKTNLAKVADLKNVDENKPDDSAKRIAEETNDKILGMPKMVAIGLGVAVLSIGGFVAYRYIKGKK